MDFNFYTLGVYGKSEQDFFDLLTKNNIDTFCDIRRRRGVRGSKYSFVNSTYLMNKLREMNIRYHHLLDLSPTNEIREIQKTSDKEDDILKTRRECLSPRFIAEYEEKILLKYDFNSFFDMLDKAMTSKVVFFCVEGNPQACHRSILAEYITKNYKYTVTDL